MNTSYVASDASVVIFFRPDRAMKHPALGKLVNLIAAQPKQVIKLEDVRL